MTLVLAIDPGPTESAWVTYDTDLRIPVTFAKQSNDTIIKTWPATGADTLAVEMIASYGMAVGASTFETCVWIGRFVQRWAMLNPGVPWSFVYRKDVKMHLCGSVRAKDANIRQAIMDKYGSTREAAIGKKATPGPLYGISSDVWAALGVAITTAEGAA